MSHTDRSDSSGLQRRIIEVGVELFNDNGYHATSVQDICDAAAVTKGSFYYYFASKDELLLQIHSDYIDHALQRYQTIVEKELPPRESIRELMRSLLYGVAAFGPWVTVFEQEWRHLTKDEFANVRRTRDEIADVITKEIQRGVDLGTFRPVASPRVTAFALLGMSAWAHRWYRPGGELNAEAVSDMWSDMILDGLSSGEGVGRP